MRLDRPLRGYVAELWLRIVIMVWRSLSTPSSAVRLLHTAAFKPTCICLDENYRIINKAQHTYHPRGYENSQGYLRARKPYAVRNALTFLALASFVGGVYAYSIMMVCGLVTNNTGGTR